MKKIIILALVPLINACVGYHIYSGVNAIAFAGTGKGLADHSLSTATGNDCNALNVVKDKYYCEVPREPGTTYNRSAF